MGSGPVARALYKWPAGRLLDWRTRRSDPRGFVGKYRVPASAQAPSRTLLTDSQRKTSPREKIVLRNRKQPKLCPAESSPASNRATLTSPALPEAPFQRANLERRPCLKSKVDRLEKLLPTAQWFARPTDASHPPQSTVNCQQTVCFFFSPCAESVHPPTILHHLTRTILVSILLTEHLF